MRYLLIITRIFIPAVFSTLPMLKTAVTGKIIYKGVD